MSYCVSCGRPNAGSFCHSCGARQPGPATSMGLTAIPPPARTGLTCSFCAHVNIVQGKWESVLCGGCGAVAVSPSCPRCKRSNVTVWTLPGQYQVTCKCGAVFSVQRLVPGSRMALVGTMRIRDAKVNGSGLLGTVLKGDFEGWHLGYRKGGALVVFGPETSFPILENLVDYNVIGEQRKGGAGAGAAAAGLVLLGPLGLAAGAIGLRKKRVAIMRWSTDQESLVEVRSGTIHQKITEWAALRSYGFA